MNKREKTRGGKRQLKINMKWVKIVLAVIVIGVGVGGVRMLSKAFAFNWKYGNTIAVISKDGVSIVRYTPGDKQALLWKLEPDLMVPVALSDGEYRLKALWRYGEVEGSAGEIVKDSLMGYVGVWIDGFIYLPNADLDNPVDWKWFRTGWKQTDIGIGDRWKFVSAYMGLREDQIVRLTIPENIEQIEEWPDGTRAVRVESERIRLLVDQEFLEGEILEKDVLVKVFNSSSSPGMARMMEHMVNNAGGRVVEVETADEKIADFCIFEANKQEKEMKEWLKKIGCKMKAETDEIGVKIWVGEKWAERFE